MGYRLEISESANRDLDEILTYIAEKLANPKAAADFADELERRYDALEANPFMFEVSRNKRLCEKGYRRFHAGNYVVFYTVDEEYKRVNISRIFYGRRNYEQYL